MEIAYFFILHTTGVYANYALELFQKFTDGHEFNYTQNWYSLSSVCSGSLQSPIDITTDLTEMTNLPQVLRENYIENPDVIKVSKGTHNFVVHPIYDEVYPRVVGGPLEGAYRLDHITFHWGKDDNIGSEHTINGLRYPLEMQAIHYNDKFNNLSDALQEPSGVAIISYLFNVSSMIPGDLGIDLIQKTFDNLAQQEEGEVNVQHSFPMSILAPAVYRQYITYMGSLTLPPCVENILWIVSYKSRMVSTRQINNFRKLYQSTPTLLNNFRPTQITNNRKLYVVK